MLRRACDQSPQRVDLLLRQLVAALFHCVNELLADGGRRLTASGAFIVLVRLMCMRVEFQSLIPECIVQSRAIQSVIRAVITRAFALGGSLHCRNGQTVAKGSFCCRHSRRHALTRTNAEIGKRLLNGQQSQHLAPQSDAADDTLAFWLLSSRLWKILSQSSKM